MERLGGDRKRLLEWFGALFFHIQMGNILFWGGVGVDKAPRFSIRRVIWILLSDTETSAATPPGVIQKK